MQNLEMPLATTVTATKQKGSFPPHFMRVMDSSQRTSPVKKRPPVTQHRQELSRQIEDFIPTTTDFVAKRLQEPPSPLLRAIKVKTKKPIKAFTHLKTEQKSYDLICQILNIISDLSYGQSRCIILPRQR